MLDSIGIKISVSEIPEYVEYARLRDRLGMMHPVRRWLSFRLRRELQFKQERAEMGLLCAIMEAADNALD